METFKQLLIQYFTPPPPVYLHADLNGLNAFELAWVGWYRSFDNPVVATAILTFLMHELVYFGRCVPFLILDCTKWGRKYKIQPTKEPSAAVQWRCTKTVLYTHFVIELPQMLLFEPAGRFLGMSTWEVPFPEWKTIAQQVTLFFFLEDTWHYWAHRLFHYKSFYKYVHKIHHEHSAPFGLAAEYAHPLEVVTLGLGTVLSPLLFCWWTGNLHLITVYIWISLRLFQAVDSHSGYQFPWGLNRFFWLWAGSEHHDYHHQAFVGNYSSSFRHWDWLCGTDKSYHEFKKRKQMEALQKKKEDNRW
ncbi:C-4 methylsterol oxidase [Meredithblackwellia eburnea MCA 4105]